MNTDKIYHSSIYIMASNYIQISNEVQKFEKKWDNIYSQTEFFNRFIPKKNVDFTKTFLEKGLDKVFIETHWAYYWLDPRKSHWELKTWTLEFE